MNIDFNSGLLIHAGALFYIIAFLIRDELKLRLMVLAGSAFYLLYYYFFPEIPLWDAIITTCILVLANIIILFRILMERTVFTLSQEEKSLFEAFDGFTPGQFRQLLKIAQWHKVDAPMILAQQDVALSKLYFVAQGPVTVQKGDYQFGLGAGSFVGEIAFVLKRAPTATVTAQPGASFVQWDIAQIRGLMVKSLAFHNAIMALLSRDLADKLATSVQIDQLTTRIPTI